MSDDVFPLKPAHPLASGSEISESRSLLLYRGEMTGRWFDVAVTTTTRSTSSGGDTQTKTVHAELDASGVGEVALKLSPDPHLEWLFRHLGVSVGGVPVPPGVWPVRPNGERATIGGMAPSRCSQLSTSRPAQSSPRRTRSRGMTLSARRPPPALGNLALRVLEIVFLPAIMTQAFRLEQPAVVLADVGPEPQVREEVPLGRLPKNHISSRFREHEERTAVR